MAISSIANSLNTKMRVSGLASGLDTDTLVKQMMTIETAKLDRLMQKRETSLWRTAAYRDVTSTLKGFYDEYLDTLSAKNMKSANSFSSFSSSYAASTSTDYVSITPDASAKAGTYSITDIKAATSAFIQGGEVSTPVEGLKITGSVADIKSSNNNNIFSFTLNNKTVQFTLNEGENLTNDGGDFTTVTGLKDELQARINDAFGAGKISVGVIDAFKVDSNGDYVVDVNGDKIVDGEALKFSTVRVTDTFKIGTVYNDGASTLFSVAPTTESPFILNSGNNKFQLKIGDTEHTVEVPVVGDGKYEDAELFKIAIKNAVADSAFGAGADISFAVTDGKVTYASGQMVTVSKTQIDANKAIGINTAKMSNKLDMTAKIFDIKDGFLIKPTVIGAQADIKFTINEKLFEFDSKTTSINDVLKKVNADTSINASLKYDFTSNSFKIESKGSGITDNLVVADVLGGLMASLKVIGDEDGSDASLKIDGELIVRPKNVFTYDGLTFNIKKDSEVAADPIMVTIASDTTKTYDFIKGFVDKYNEIVGKLNTKVNEKKYREYLPLTDAQREAMTDGQIEKWETSAKSGLLKGDSIISETLSKMRSSLYASVEGVGISLYSIGITTSSNYNDSGKLIINESKLKEALTNNPDEVAKLFTNKSSTSYYDAMDSSTARIQRDKESGLAERLSDALQDAIRTTTDKDGHKGMLLEKAGIVGDRSEINNLLYTEISNFDKAVTEMNRKLADRETALYTKFSAMETALNKMNSQSSWIAQQFGSGS